MERRNDLVSLVNWNVEWRLPDSRAAPIIQERLWDSDPDIICLTETYEDFLDRAGHVISSEADYGYPIREGRRKVLLWSKQPWQRVDRIGSTELPSGRFVQGYTQTAIGLLNVIGVCIPWSGAHMSSGRRDRRKWEDHLDFLAGLEPLLATNVGKTILMGDYNQKIPRTTAPLRAYKALETSILRHFQTPTAGLIEPLGVQVIDHVSHSSDLAAGTVRAISNLDPVGKQLTDHLGVRLVIRGSE